MEMVRNKVQKANDGDSQWEKTTDRERKTSPRKKNRQSAENKSRGKNKPAVKEDGEKPRDEAPPILRGSRWQI